MSNSPEVNIFEAVHDPEYVQTKVDAFLKYAFKLHVLVQEFKADEDNYVLNGSFDGINLETRMTSGLIVALYANDGSERTAKGRLHHRSYGFSEGSDNQDSKFSKDNPLEVENMHCYTNGYGMPVVRFATERDAGFYSEVVIQGSNLPDFSAVVQKVPSL